jgi:hypothetical protein
MVLMTLGMTIAWAQHTLKDGGCYYISIKEKTTPNPTPNTNYYICPTENWIWFDNNKDYGYDTSDNGRPFMTTYQCRNTTAHPDYDSDKAVWVIKKQKTVSEIDYYSIRHAVDGRYLTYNANLKNITKGGKNNRLRLHLESSNSPKDNDNMLFSFTIPEDKSYYVITPKPASGYYICIAEGNVDELQGSTTSPTGNKKEDGPKDYEKSIYGTLGIYTDKNDANSPMLLEEVPVYPPTVTINEGGTVSMTSTSGTIYYTTDDTDPRTSGTRIAYSGTISANDIANFTGNAIKVVAIDGDNKSMLVTIPLATYTYHIVNRSNGIAVSSSAIKQVAGTKLADEDFRGYYNSIPEGLRSPYISDETITFYTMEGDFDASKLENEYRITATPDESANIYVTYTTDKLGQKFLHFQGARPFNFKNSSGQYYYDNGTSVVAETKTAGYVTDKNHLWYFYGSDPYNIQIKNADSNKYLTTSGSAPARSDDAVPFFLTGQSGEGATSRQITLKNVSNGETIELNINTVVLPLSYTLIDRENKVIERGISYDADDGLILPVAWRSPLVDYHYWNADAFEQTVSGTPDEPFVFNDSPTEITTATTS